MRGQYRLTKATLGIVIATHLATKIPEDSILEIVTPPQPDDRTVLVTWNGEPMFVFAQDLADRGRKIDSRLTGIAASA